MVATSLERLVLLPPQAPLPQAPPQQPPAARLLPADKPPQARAGHFSAQAIPEAQQPEPEHLQQPERLQLSAAQVRRLQVPLAEQPRPVQALEQPVRLAQRSRRRRTSA